jgi:predicted Rossmann fold flavoprotein
VYTFPIILCYSARYLFDAHYKAQIEVCWCTEFDKNTAADLLQTTKNSHPKRHIQSFSPFPIPLRLWKWHAMRVGTNIRWTEMSREKIGRLAEYITCDRFEVCGQTTNKEEFVTCDGISLQEVDFKTMASTIIEHCYFAGEVLDVDAITGGFNFQNAWTTGFLAGTSMACSLVSSDAEHHFSS